MASNSAMFVSMPFDEFMKIVSDTVKNEFEQFKNSVIKSQEEEIMTIEEAASFFQVSKVTIHKRMNDKSLPFYKLGRKTFFKKKELLEAIKLITLKTNNERFR